MAHRSYIHATPITSISPGHRACCTSVCQQTGDELVSSWAGDEIVCSRIEIEIVGLLARDKIVCSRAGDEIISSQAGDEIVCSLARDEIVCSHVLADTDYNNGDGYGVVTNLATVEACSDTILSLLIYYRSWIRTPIRFHQILKMVPYVEKPAL